MMISLFRRSAILALVSSTLLTSWLGVNLKAIALPEQQVLERLKTITVFTIADDKGAPLIAVIENEQKVTGVFISRLDAEAYLQEVQKNKPDIAKNVKVIPVNLTDAYKLQESQKEPNGLIVDYVPISAQVELAKKILKENGQEYKGGVPLFVVKAGKDQYYIPVSQNNQPVIPMFFEKEPATALAEDYKKQNPQLASTVKIDVIPLEIVMETLKQSDDEMLNSILLVPSKETLEFIRSNLPKEPAQTQQKK